MLPREAPIRRRAAEPAARALIRLGAAFATAAIALAIAACGSQGDETSVAQSYASLTVTLDRDGRGGEPPRTKNVACSGDSCYGIEESDFAPVPPGTACTEIYGGPDVATVEGEFDGGAHVRVRLTRSNGCEIERFDRFDSLLRSVFPGYEPGAALG